jgi:hypothetical protein
MRFKEYLHRILGNAGRRIAGIPRDDRDVTIFHHAGLLVAAIAFLVYANALGNGFVWDDDIVIVANSASRSNALSLFSGIDAGREFELTPYYRPLTLLSFLIENRLHGLNPFLMHFLNVLLHAANAFLVYRLAQKLTGSNQAAILAGLLFAVHPLNTEAVDFISGGRNTLLACLFVLSAYLLHSRSVDRQNLAVAGSVLFLAALFSKETALGLLLFIIVLESSRCRSETSGSKLRSFGRLLPYVVFTIVYFILRGTALSGAGVRLEILPGLGTRLLDNLYIIPRYLLTVIWPPLLSPRYYVPDDLHLVALPLLAAWLGIICALTWLFTRGRSRAAFFGLSWLAIFWLPVSGIVPFPSAAMADRYFYVPAIGLWIIAADQAARFLPSNALARKRAYGVVALFLLVLAGMTVLRNIEWRSDVALFSGLVKQYPEQAFGHHNLGCAYLDKVGDLDSAEREFERALELDPFFPRLRTQLGYVRLLKGDYEGALHHYNEAVSQNPFDAEALLNRAMALDKLGRYEEAAVDYRRFLAAPGNELPQARPQAEARLYELSR